METKGDRSDMQPTQQHRDAPRDSWDEELHPDHMKGQNVGRPLQDREVAIATAFDIKEVHRALGDFSDEDLKQVPILPVGARLQQGATYVDLADDRRQEFRPTGGIEVRQGQYVVPKDRVPYWIWNRLIREEKPGQA